MEEDGHSFRRGTLVAGSFTKNDFQSEIDKINQVIGRYIDSYFNAKPAKYKLQAKGFESSRLIELEEVFADDFKRLEPDWNERRIRQYQQYHICHRFAFLFPFHKLAFVLYSYGFNQLDGVREKLGQLGYRVVEKRKETERGRLLYSTQWNNENYREFLRELRTKEHLQEVGVDKRLIEIIERVHKMINASGYQFGIFIPKFWGKRKPKHRYDTITEGLVVSPVKKLVEVHGQWLNSSLESLVEGLDLTRAIGLTSKVQTSEGIRHISMIDFEDALKLNKWNYRFETKLSDALDKINMEGIIVSSGNSYHFYGNRLLTENEWVLFMEMLKKVLFVDEKWPDLQLKQGFSMLRITPSIRKFSQPCYLMDYHPKRTGTDFDSLGNTEELKEKISITA